MWLWVTTGYESTGWAGQRSFPSANDDQALQATFSSMWTEFCQVWKRGGKILRIGVTLLDLSKADSRQLDLFHDDDPRRQRWERITQAMDSLNSKYGRTVASLGVWNPPVGGNVGGKISFTRIPCAEDFW
jgi:DNA polymerase-4